MGEKLTVTAWDANFNGNALQAAADDYKANVDPDFELEINIVSGSSDVENDITNAGSSGDYSLLSDIVLFQDRYIKNFVENYPDAWVNLDGAEINWDDITAVKQSYSTIDGVQGTVSHFLMKRYKEDGLVFEQHESDTRLAVMP